LSAATPYLHRWDEGAGQAHGLREEVG
jgi:hypothetical protein